MSKILKYTLILSVFLWTGHAVSDTEDNLSLIKRYGDCMNNNPMKKQGKICGAYVPFGGELAILIDCLRNLPETKEEIDYDNIGNVFEINYTMRCGNKRIAVTLATKENPDNLYVKWVGEIVN